METWLVVWLVGWPIVSILMIASVTAALRRKLDDDQVTHLVVTSFLWPITVPLAMTLLIFQQIAGFAHRFLNKE